MASVENINQIIKDGEKSLDFKPLDKVIETSQKSVNGMFTGALVGGIGFALMRKNIIWGILIGSVVGGFIAYHAAIKPKAVIAEIPKDNKKQNIQQGEPIGEPEYENNF